MTSPVVVANLALSHLGDAGAVTSLSPPDGTRQAALCARFIDLARKQMLEARDWTFAIQRTTVADLDDPVGPWLYRYAYPNNCIRVSKVLGSTSEDHEPTEPFTVEADDSGVRTILTGVPQASVVYVHNVTDFTRYTTGALTALSYLLASYVAGPLIKGEEGAGMGRAMLETYLVMLSAGATADASQHRPPKGHTPSSVTARL